MYIAIITDEIHAKEFTDEEAKQYYNAICELLRGSVILCYKSELDSKFWRMKEASGAFYINEVV